MYLRPLRRFAISLSLTLCLATLGVSQVMAQSVCIATETCP